ncbi:guanitoxin biosynthesis heme-dependent pre-guanitoxin N-hydroxylase GntA [Gelidibacter mesophilus]|uniref:guanitoxin biosynthesis heme-dependent pre-guanitoxin N-hydroxylase GntA n=1 Tax=Gelidibacter mesophilus TaxID=169050 RepID=UPI0006844FB8|nr:guanitoxin biosynthesis heme-dependent pre-guanitoxin N-hydroxylase GntA [Gelidibacter mesophilus]
MATPILKKAQDTIEYQYRDFILKRKHPCVMANTIFMQDDYKLKIYDDITSDSVVAPVLSDLDSYIKDYDFDSNAFETILFCFKENNFKTELQFENALWKFLQKLHDNDDKDWDTSVNREPENANFSFSIKGKAFYIIGMHPNSSRIARQAPYCTLVFNLHWQFEKLRDMGIYQNIKKRIRRRDKKLQGTINPVLKDFGKASETRQYSGREVEADWKCPFTNKK